MDNYAKSAWEVLRDFHKCDNMSRNDFDFETIHPCDSYYVVFVSKDGKMWFKFYFEGGGLERLFEYYGTRTLLAAYEFDQETNDLILTDNNGKRI